LLLLLTVGLLAQLAAAKTLATRQPAPPQLLPPLLPLTGGLLAQLAAAKTLATRQPAPQQRQGWRQCSCCCCC
jgi:hypothetical protein